MGIERYTGWIGEASCDCRSTENPGRCVPIEIGSDHSLTTLSLKLAAICTRLEPMEPPIVHWSRWIYDWRLVDWELQIAELPIRVDGIFNYQMESSIGAAEL